MVVQGVAEWGGVGVSSAFMKSFYLNKYMRAAFISPSVDMFGHFWGMKKQLVYAGHLFTITAYKDGEGGVSRDNEYLNIYDSFSAKFVILMME